MTDTIIEPNKQEKRACVIGWPIEHSRSPLIHNFWIREHALCAQYSKVAVPAEELSTFVNRIKNGEYIGCNVTIPYKQTILDYVDIIHPTAQRLGAANTLWMEKDGLHADNTDGQGFLGNLDHSIPGWDKKRGEKTALILGAGGASRPIIDVLLTRGFSITMINRTREKAEQIKDRFSTQDNQDQMIVENWDNRSSLCDDKDLLVNATALGMTGQPALDLSLEALPLSAIVCDIVYVPLKTDLLQKAEQRGNRIANGLGMLLHQAIPGFEKWFGLRPTITDDLRKAVLK